MKKFKNMIAIIVATAISLSYTANAQVSINTDGSDPDPSSMLDVKSSDKGMLIPRLTQIQIEGITSPANGLTVFNTDDNKLYAYRDCSSLWIEIAVGTETITPVIPFCGDSIVDSRDGQFYSIVLIGSQCWMAENLNIGTMVNSSSNQYDNSTIEKYCYNNSPTYCDTYGGLYQWNEMMQYVITEGTQGICPTGWHIPTDDEYKTLEMQLGMSQAAADSAGYRGTDEGGKLKETGTTHWDSPNIGATNSSGFTALPGGYRQIVFNPFVQIGSNAYFWSSSNIGPFAWIRSLFYLDSRVERTEGLNERGYSVRCVRN